jgi:hypothetical protein
MNITGGARRIQFAGHCLIRFSQIVFGVCLCVLLIAILFPKLGLHVALLGVIIAPLLITVPGATLWFLGWVVEGFADNDPEQERVRT